MAITLADFQKIWASTSPLTPYSFSEANYKQGWNFIGSTPPARQMWDFLQKNNDEKMQYLANNYLPLSGGTMSGTITKSGGGVFVDLPNSSSSLYFNSFNSGGNGAQIALFGKDHAGAGRFDLTANDGTNSSNLRGLPNGTLTWGGNAILTDANYNSYALPLSGGTMSGNGEIKYIGIDNKVFRLVRSGGSLGEVGWGWNDSQGSGFALHSSSSSTAGRFDLFARSSAGTTHLLGDPNGTLTWGGQPIQTSSDKRLKQDFSDVPDDVLEAWGKVNWQQFKYKEDVERKGDSCRFHTGLVAQDVKEVGEENHVDLLKYGILCHDVREAVEEEKDEDGNVIREASEAVDLWTIRYEEALCMEASYQRRRADRLEARIEALEKLLMK